MKPSPDHPGVVPAGCAILAHAGVAVSFTEIAALRDAPVPEGAPALPARFLRHCDEHTVVAMRAVLDAIASIEVPLSLERCGVVAAPCQAGRIATARSLAQLPVGGAVTVSPHIVPQCSLHSVAGAVSVALGMHGPHIGVGGGPDALAEGLFAAMTLFQCGAASGCDSAWVIATSWDEEPTLAADGTPEGNPVCRAVAMLATATEMAPHARLTLALHMTGEAGGAEAMPTPLASFARALEMCGHGMALAGWSVACPWGAEIRLAVRPADDRQQGLDRMASLSLRRREAA